jgi:hypothetical protein
MIAAGLALAACAMLPSVALAGVVVSASGPSAGTFPVGKKIGDSEKIVLRAGDTLTVLDGKGTRVLRGAGTYSLDQQAGPARTGAFAALTERRSAARVRTGAVRCEPDDKACQEAVGVSPTNLWYVDLTHPGKTCLADTERVRLWRGVAEGEASYVIRAAGGGSQTVAFSDGSISAAWDQQALPLAAGTEYRVSGADGGEQGPLSVVILPNVADQPEALAQQLIENGCTRQLELLSSAMMIEAN